MIIKEYLTQPLSKLDLSTKGSLSHKAEELGIVAFSEYLYSEILHGKVGYGGYLEKRNMYEQSQLFFDHDLMQYRNIHLGVDVWCEANTEVYAPFNCEVHSFQYNGNELDYGNTIIVKGVWEKEQIHLLFGHLSDTSLKHIAKKKSLKKGDLVGWLGNSNENGGWPPHLHLQAIKDLQGKAGDYPGLCCEAELPFYQQNCPDPTGLLL